DRRDERAIEPRDDLMGEEIALVLDFLDLLGLVPHRLVAGQHDFELIGAPHQFVGQRLEISVELLFPRDQTHSNGPLLCRTLIGLKRSDCSRSVYAAVTLARPGMMRPGVPFAAESP